MDAFYKETAFKETPIGRIPKDWNITRLGDIAVEVYRYPTYYSIKYVDSGRPEVRGKLIGQDGELEEDLSKYRFISKETSQRFSRTILQEGDFVLSVRGTMGKVAMIPSFLEGANITANLMRISLDPSYCYPAFFKYIFLSEKFRKTLNLLSSQTTIKTIQAPVLKSIRIPLPSLSEQQKIAEILSTVYEAIQKVDEIIVKTERLKEGLMQELLTKGIGHKEFKETPIGKTPKTWQVVRLGDKGIAKIRSGKKLNGFDKVGFITMEHVPDSGIFTKYEIRDVKDVRSHTYCEAGDLLLSKITPCFENGKQGIVPQEVPNGFALATTEVFPIICDGIDPMFLFYILKFNKFRKILEFSMRGTTGRQRVPKNAVEKLRIHLPPKEEQEKIARVLLTVDKKLEIERKNKEKLEKIKQGLMDLLLTGRIRVKVY